MESSAGRPGGSFAGSTSGAQRRCPAAPPPPAPVLPHPEPRGAARAPLESRRGKGVDGAHPAMGARRGALSDVRPSRPPAARCRLRPRPPSCPQSVSRWEGTSPALTHGDGGCGDSGGQEAGPGRASTAAPSGRPARSPGAVCADRRRPVPARRLSRRGSCARTRRPAISISPER